jgi:hypothetical protein
MTELLKKGAKFEWGQKCEDAFHTLCDGTSQVIRPTYSCQVQRTLDNPVDAHNYSTSSISISFSLPKSISPVTQILQHIEGTNKWKRITIT